MLNHVLSCQYLTQPSKIQILLFLTGTSSVQPSYVVWHLEATEALFALLLLADNKFMLNHVLSHQHLAQTLLNSAVLLENSNPLLISA